MSASASLTDRQRFWLEHLRACAGRSLKAYAEEHGLAPASLYQAKARLQRMGVLGATTARFVRVERQAPTSSPALCRIRLPNAAVIELACDPEHWPALLASVAALP